MIRVDELCCFGTGATPDQATEQARRWLPGNKAIEILPELPLLGSVPGVEGLFMAKVTPRLAEAVQAKGGASWLRFTVGDNGELDLSGDIPDDSMDRFEQGLERLRFEVETENAAIFALRVARDANGGREVQP